MSQDSSLSKVVAELAEATKSYEHISGTLKQELEGLVPDPTNMVCDLLSWSEEFGREHAIELFQNDLHTYPADPRVIESWDQRAAAVSKAVDATLNAQDRLDALTRERDALTGGAQRTLNIQGQEFELHSARGVLRDARGEEHKLDREPELTLTQKIARDLQSEPVQADDLQQNRSPGRSR